MKLLDKYIFKQLLGPFVFFMMVFIGLLWLNRALLLIDIVIKNGQPASIFVELSLYLLPTAIEISIPIASFAASVLVTNRLFSESELVVMMTAGRSVFNLAFPYLIFGIFCAFIMAIIVHFATPLTMKHLQKRQDEISQHYITQIIKPGEFITQNNRFTFFFRKKGADGTLEDIMISEKISNDHTITHFAQKGQVVTQNGDTKLLLLNGTIQDYNRIRNNLNVIKFSSISYDLNQFSTSGKIRQADPSLMTTPALLTYIDKISFDKTKHALSLAELHSSFAKCLLVLLAPIIGMSSLLIGKFSRTGFGFRIVLSIVIMFAINTLLGIARSWVADQTMHWSVSYLSVFITLIIVLFFLFLGSNNITSLKKRLFTSYKKQVET